MEIGVTKAVQDKIKSKLAAITKDVALVFCLDIYLEKFKRKMFY